MNQCPSCNTNMSFKMGYSGGVPIVIYKCENCGYTSFGESYTTNNTTTQTTGTPMVVNSTSTIYDPSYSVKRNKTYTQKKQI